MDEITHICKKNVSIDESKTKWIYLFYKITIYVHIIDSKQSFQDYFSLLKVPVYVFVCTL